MEGHILCVWEGTIVGEERKSEFEEWAKSEFGVTAKYSEELKTNPTPGEIGTGNRNDLLFWIPGSDASKFAIIRLAYGIRWWEDYASHTNGTRNIIPENILEKYKDQYVN